MWESLRRWFSTGTHPVNDIAAAYIRQNEALMDLLRKQQETMDRIVTAKYDRPVTSTQPVEPSPTLPPFMMSDQPGSVMDALTTESDVDFLEKAPNL